MTNKTATLLVHMPQSLRDTLVTSAKEQLVTRYGRPSSLFDDAQRLIETGQVELITPKLGHVYDHSSWQQVSYEACGHRCTDPICVHKVAVAAATLLARYAAESAGNRPAMTPTSEPGTGPSGGSLHGYRSPAISLHVPRAKGSDHRHCKRCGGFLDAGGACHLCGGQ